MFTRIHQYLDGRKRRREQATARREKFQAQQSKMEALFYARFDEIRELTIDEARIQTFDLLDNMALCSYTALFYLKPASGQAVPMEDQLAPSIRELFSKYSSVADPSGTFEIGVTWIERLKRMPPFIRIGSGESGDVAVMPGDERIYVIRGQRPLDADGSNRNVYGFLLEFAAMEEAILAD